MQRPPEARSRPAGAASAKAVIDPGRCDEAENREAPRQRPAAYVCGCDPGLTGGIAFLDLSAPGKIIAVDLPIIDRELNAPALAQLLRSMEPVAVVLEAASSRPKQGISSAFSSGMIYGQLLATFAVVGIPVRIVSAAKWKRAYGLTANKEESRALAIRRWPTSAAFGAEDSDHHRARGGLTRRSTASSRRPRPSETWSGSPAARLRPRADE